MQQTLSTCSDSSICWPPPAWTTRVCSHAQQRASCLWRQRISHVSFYNERKRYHKIRWSSLRADQMGHRTSMRCQLKRREGIWEIETRNVGANNGFSRNKRKGKAAELLFEMTRVQSLPRMLKAKDGCFDDYTLQSISLVSPQPC